MEQNEEIDIQLWEYIDGNCNISDMQRISILIERDDLWKKKYKELLALHTGISGSLQLEEPSLRFTKNVMDTVATVSIAPATKMYINKGIIRGIAAFFIITIATFFGYALTTAKWGADSTGFLSKFDFSKIDFSSLFSSSAFMIIITVNVALGLLLLDSVLRRKRQSHS